MNSLNKIILCVAIMSLSACATTQVIPQTEMPASLTSPCEALELLQGMTGGDLTKNITNNAAIHYRCVDKYNALIEAVSPKGVVKPKNK